MRNRFDEQLMQLNRELIEMGALCEEAISVASESLLANDKQLASKVAPLDSEIDRKERTIESLCLKLLLQQQPVARDLRQISAALKMITDMERIGDQAEDIAEIICSIDVYPAGNSRLLQEMADATIKMVTESVDAFVKNDIIIAKKVIEDDDIVDSIAEDPDNGEFAIDILIIAKYFERIGDHAVNIAQWVIFSVTGEHKEV